MLAGLGLRMIESFPHEEVQDLLCTFAGAWPPLTWRCERPTVEW